MTTKGTHKFQYTEGLRETSRNVSAQPGICGTPASGFAFWFVAAMIAIVGAVVLGFMGIPHR